MKIILATAYDINPFKGSESATGWNFILQIARFNKVIAITRINNRKEIERYVKEFNINISNIQFFYFDLPYYLRFWKKGPRGASIYFYLWQMFMPLYVKKKKLKFDIVHNVNFHADAFPSFLWVLRKPFVWGPINHHEKIPKEYVFPKNEYLKDRIKWFFKIMIWNFDPFMFLTKLKSDIIIGGNSSVQKRLKLPQNKFRLLSQVASNNAKNYRQDPLKVFIIIIAARFIALKGIDIALYSFNEFYKNLSFEEKKNVKLTILGQGPLENHLKKIRNNLPSKNNIEFIGWVDSEEMNSFYKNSNVFLFPSHEGAGMVIAEALANGLPVVCFDNYGPGELVNESCSVKISYSNKKESIKDFAIALTRLYKDHEFYKMKSQGAFELFKNKHNWDSKGLALKTIYDELKFDLTK